MFAFRAATSASKSNVVMKPQHSAKACYERRLPLYQPKYSDLLDMPVLLLFVPLHLQQSSLVG